MKRSFFGFQKKNFSLGKLFTFFFFTAMLVLLGSLRFGGQYDTDKKINQGAASGSDNAFYQHEYTAASMNYSFYFADSNLVFNNETEPRKNIVKEAIISFETELDNLNKTVIKISDGNFMHVAGSTENAPDSFTDYKDGLESDYKSSGIGRQLHFSTNTGIPEPATMLILGICLVMLASVAKKRST